MLRKFQLGALLAILTYAGGCTPAYLSQQQIEEIRSIAEGAQATAQEAVDQTGIAERAERMAAEAQATAEEALAAANAAQACCDATNERVDRMFEEQQAK